MLEVVPYEQGPRLYRLGHNQNDYTGGYFQEAYAALSYDGLRVTWGAWPA